MPNNCFCDQRGIGDPTQTCGDCPEDYRERDKGGMMNEENETPPAGTRDAVTKAELVLPVLRRSAEGWGNHHCASELRRAIELVESLLALTSKADGEPK